jgi:hypothetical protein
LRTRLWLLALVVIVSAAVPMEAARDKTPPPDLSGKWKLNDDVTYRMMQGMRERGSHFGGPGGMGGGRRPGGSGGGGGRPPGGGSRPEFGRRPEHREGMPMESLDELTITQQDQVVTITDSAGRSRALQTHGKKVKDESAPGGPATVKARWKDGALEVTIKPQRGPKRTESWVITNDRKRLFLTLTLDGGPPFPMRRAYDRVEEAPAKDSSKDPAAAPS